MAFVGNIGEFDATKEDFDSYCDRLNQYLTANDIAAEKHVAVFLTVIGAKCFGLLRNLLAPEKLSSKSFQELVQTLKQHLQPKPLIIAERFKFNKRNQLSGETVSDYCAELRNLAKTCDFNQFLEDALRDRFVCGLISPVIQKKLLSVADLNFNKAVQLAVTMEMAERDACTFHQSSGTPADVKRVSQAPRSGNKHNKGSHKGKRNDFNSRKLDSEHANVKCQRCGKTGHSKDRCRYKTYTCHNCGKRGHLKNACKSNPRKEGTESARFIAETEHEKFGIESETELGVFSIDHTASAKPADNRPLKVTIEIDKKPIEFEVDTGASVTIIPEDIYSEKLSHATLMPCKKTLRTYTQETMDLAGQIKVDISYRSQELTSDIVVAKLSKQPAILGRDLLSHLKLDWQSLFRIADSSLQALLDKIQAVV